MLIFHWIQTWIHVFICLLSVAMSQAKKYALCLEERIISFKLYHLNKKKCDAA